MLPRGPGHYAACSPAFDYNCLLFNQALLVSCNAKFNQTRFFLLQHSRLSNEMPLLVNGVHLTQAGLKKYYFSIRQAIIHAKQLI